MKSKDVQSLVLSKYEDRQSCAETHGELHSSVSLLTIERWHKMIENTSWITIKINGWFKNKQNRSKHTEGKAPT